MNRASDRPSKTPIHPFRRAVLRGLGMVMPTLLTIALFAWAWAQIDGFLLQPIESLTTRIIVATLIESVHDEVPGNVNPTFVQVRINGQASSVPQTLGDTNVGTDWRRQVEARGGRIVSYRSKDGTVYVPVSGNHWIPQYVFDTVKADPDDVSVANAAPLEIYRRYVRLQYLRRSLVIPVFLVGFIAILYVLGRFLAAGVGRILWNSIERLIHHLPIIRNVYSSVKQVSDFVFSEQEIEFTRVVAVEYPRKGVWSVGFVTGESMQDIRSAANEPVVTVLMPTSPMPATGFTITVRKSETIDLDLSIDQAIQFVVSCGVVVPANQQIVPLPADALNEAIAKRLAGSGDVPSDGALPSLPPPSTTPAAPPADNGHAAADGQVAGERSSVEAEPEKGASP